MEQDKKSVIKLIGLMFTYILLSVLGFFGQVGLVLFPIISVPFTLFCMRNKVAKELQILFHVIVSIAIYLMAHSVLGIFIYIASAVIPAYIILFLYKQELALPNIIMYGGLVLAAIVFVYFSIMKGLGFDFEAQFCASLDMITTEFNTMLASVVHAGAPNGISMGELQASMNQVKELISVGIETLKTFYPAIVVSQTVVCFGITVIIVNAIARRKMVDLPHTRQILEFRVSKVAVLLLIVSMLLIDTNSTSGTVIVLALNLMSFLASLFEIVGMFSLIEILRRTSVNTGIKILGYVGIVILFMASPYLLMFSGCLDALFNYRKVSIVV